jgi:hypothetical protein
MKKREPVGYRIYRYEALSKAFKRIILEQLHQSLKLCDQFGITPDPATHEIRKCTKRIRAVYRLYRSATGDVLFRHGKTFYGNLSQVLAVHRISAAHIETLQLLATDKRLSINSAYLHNLSAEVEKRHQQLTHHIFQDQQADRYLTETLSAEIKAMAKKPLLSCDFHDLTPGLRRTYGQGKKSLDLAIQHPSTENFHELRKMVKSLWYQFLLIRPIWPSYIGLEAHHLDILAQRLGLEHDLAELDQFLSREGIGKDEMQLGLLLDFIAKKRLQVQKSLIPLAKRLYAEKPVRMSERMEEFYRIVMEG